MSKLELYPSPLISELPITIGALTLDDAQPDAITAILPERGKAAAVKKALGAWPDAGASVVSKHGRLIWSGLDQAFLFGTADIKGAACVDISDGWVFMALEGDGVAGVLARLAPVELRRDRVETGQCLRTMLGHMMAIIIVTDAGFEIGVMSSFAETARHEIIEAMESVAALAG